MEGDTVWVADKKQESSFLIFIKKYAIIIIDAIIVLTIATILIIRALKSSTLDILIAPTTATVKINGEVYPSSGSFNFFPGTYEVEISADNFETQKYTLNLEKDSIQKLYAYLTGENEDLSIYDNLDASERGLLQFINNGSDSKLVHYLQESEVYSEFSDSLPYAYFNDDDVYLFWIEADPQNYRKLTVMRTESYIPGAAEAWIKSKGFDPDQFAIEYQDLPKEDDEQ